MASSVPPTSSPALVQEVGVLEEDIVAETENLLFSAHDTRIEIISKNTLTQVGSLAEPGFQNAKLIADAGHLVVLGNGACTSGHCPTHIFVYDIDGEVWSLRWHQSVFGALKEARLIDGSLILVNKDWIDYDAEPLEGAESDFTATEFRGIACTSYVRPEADLQSHTFSQVYKFRLSNGSEQALASWGEKNTAYVSKENIFLGEAVYHGDFLATVIERVHFSPTRIEFDSLLVDGVMNQRWWMKELAAGELVFVTNNYTFAGEVPGLYIYDQNLELKATIADFANGEDVRAVRYTGDLVYVVTYRNKDPLFAFDLSDPAHPRLLGQLEVPGYSEFLEPFGSDQLLGLGFGENGFLELSLFDVLDPLHLELHSKTAMGDENYALSLALRDPHALFISADKNLVAVPVIETSGGFSGARVVSFAGAAVDYREISHRDLMSGECARSSNQNPYLDIQRLKVIGTNLVSLSPFGMKIHPVNHPENTTGVMRFAGPHSCTFYGRQ
jgi:uncharacterized secreted protein with C-terminal beta-propeller domain